MQTCNTFFHSNRSLILSVWKYTLYEMSIAWLFQIHMSCRQPNITWSFLSCSSWTECTIRPAGTPLLLHILCSSAYFRVSWFCLLYPFLLHTAHFSQAQRAPSDKTFGTDILYKYLKQKYPFGYILGGRLLFKNKKGCTTEYYRVQYYFIGIPKAYIT